MKRIIALILSLVLLLSGCAPTQTTMEPTEDTTAQTVETMVWVDDIPEYHTLDDEDLLMLPPPYI